MVDLNNLGNFAILVDFDGTMTVKDTNVMLMDKYGSSLDGKYKKLYEEEKLSFPERFQANMNDINIKKEQYLDMILNEVELSPGFIEFYNKTKEKSIPWAVVSGGFRTGIVPFLEKHGIEDIDIYANDLIFNEDYLEIKFKDGEEQDCCDYGPCGNCKIGLYERFKKKYDTVIFIGDGITDKPVANIADIVFAKDSLLDYVEEKRIDHIPWDDFNDINRILFNMG